MTTSTSKNCPGGHYTCSPPKECCKNGCCPVFNNNNSVYRPPVVSSSSSNIFNPLFLGHWYFWLAVTATVAGILCACSLWRRHSQGNVCCRGSGRDERASEPDSNGSFYAPPQYSRCNSFHQPPPPYSEVTSKPDLYPLVISYNGDPVIKSSNGSTGYLMVQYFRNFIVGPAGSLSATSTIDSLSSSFICNATNEANNIIPPPYSSMTSLEEAAMDVNNQMADALSIPRSLSSASGSDMHQSSPSVHSHVSSVYVTSSQSTPARRIQTRPHTVISIRDNPCFGHTTNLQNTASTTTTMTTTMVPNDNIDVSVVHRIEKSQINCDASPVHRVNRKLQHKYKLPKEKSQESEDEHNFSDLLNLSVCAPSSVSNLEAPTLCNPLLQFSVANSMTGSDISSLANLGTPDSPPRATSPTVEMKELLDKIQQLPQPKSSVQQQPEVRQQSRSYFHRIQAKTMYMPLYEGPIKNKTTSSSKMFSKNWLSRSAPNTPCGNFVPTFPSHKRNPSGGQKNNRKILDEDGPLLRAHEESEDETNKSEGS